MSIFDSLKALFGQGDAAAVPALLSEGLANTNLGDLQGLVTRLQEGGLGTQVQSWLGDGQNLPITADLLKGVLADEHVQQLAQHFGIEPDAVLIVRTVQHRPDRF